MAIMLSRALVPYLVRVAFWLLAPSAAAEHASTGRRVRGRSG